MSDIGETLMRRGHATPICLARPYGAILAALLSIVVHGQTDAADQSGAGVRPGPLCGNDDVEFGQHCWLPVPGRPGCHVSWSNVDIEIHVSFEGESDCTGGRLAGTGSLFSAVHHYVAREIGLFEDGKLHEGILETESTFHGVRDEYRIVGGERHGPYTSEWHDGKRESGQYATGERQGAWTTFFSTGARDVRHYDRGILHGVRVLSDDSGDPLLTATYERGEATVVMLPRAALTRPEGLPASAVMTGAFGIAFGPDLAQLASLSCPSNSSCATELVARLVGAVSTAEDADALYAIQGEVLVEDVPQPVAGGKLYTIGISPHVGIASLSYSIGLQEQESCRIEKQKTDDVLRARFGACHSASGEFGSCGLTGGIDQRVRSECARNYFGGEPPWDLRVMYRLDLMRNASSSAFPRSAAGPPPMGIGRATNRE